MKFNDLIQNIQKISGTLRKNAISAVNIHLTVRNWLIGFYIVEFEQKGEDRAKYGEKLLQNLADSFDEEGLSYRNLNLYRQFYLVYPQISVYIPHFFQKYFGGIWQSPIAKSQLVDKKEDNIRQTPSAKLSNSKEDNSILQTVSAELQFSEKENVGIGQTVSAQFSPDEVAAQHIGQLKTYVNYYRKEIMQPDDNPPVGILLVTNKNSALVEYAVADSDRELFVSKYIVELPDKKQLEKFINEEYIKLK